MKRLLALAVVLTLPLTGCTTPKGNHVVPTASLADTTTATRTRLEAVMSALMAAAPNATRSARGTNIGPQPCGEKGPEYQVVAIDDVEPDGQHRAAVAATAVELSKHGFIVSSPRDLARDGAEVDFHDADGFDATITSSENNRSLVVTVASSCKIAPDGKYPG
jgi:hypothetical protein